MLIFKCNSNPNEEMFISKGKMEFQDIHYKLLYMLHIYHGIEDNKTSMMNLVILFLINFYEYIENTEQ